MGPTDLDLKAGVETIVYAIGSAADNTLAVVAQTISGLGEVPGGMPAGSGGAAATGVSPSWYVLIGVGLLLTASGGVLFWRRRAVARR